MEKTFYIKNMVCDRCKQMLHQELSGAAIPYSKIELGEIVATISSETDFETFNKIITQNGFEIIKSDTELLVEKIKELLQDKISVQDGFDIKVSEYLTQKLNKEYSIISKLFSTAAGMTVEKYVIHLKIEKAKEFIQMGQLTFSEIAYTLNYKSSSHLAKQFKLITGLSMTSYKTAKEWNRKTLDKIV